MPMVDLKQLVDYQTPMVEQVPLALEEMVDIMEILTQVAQEVINKRKYIYFYLCQMYQ